MPRDPRTTNALAFLEGGGTTGARFRAFDWGSTALGAPAAWPDTLKTAVSIVLGCPSPMSIEWGPELIHLCNDACIALGGALHGERLGRTAAEVWSEAWPTLGARASAALREGRAQRVHEVRIRAQRGGREEVYVTFSYGPIRAADGLVVGLCCTYSDETRQVLGRRRLRALHALVAGARQAQGANEACTTALAALTDAAHDVPFALLYSLDVDARLARLAAVSGVQPSSTPCGERIHLGAGEEPWPLSAVAASGRAELVEALPGGLAQAAGSPGGAERALVLPLRAPGQESLQGFLVAGLSPLHPLDEDYRDFLELAAGEVAALLASAAAGDDVTRAEPQGELALAPAALFSRPPEEARSPLTRLLRRILNVDGVGVLLFAQATGVLLDANDVFFDMFGYTREDLAAGNVTWRTMTPPEHVAISEAQMERLARTGQIGPYEKEYLRRDGSRAWMVFAGAALGDGVVVEYCIDVSDRRRAQAALEAREDALRASEALLQQTSKAKDDFLGVLGHELRTPLAAITLWARVIRSGAVPQGELGRALDVIIESAATQSRLVDDLLDLSRLASGKLVLSPMEVVVEEAARSAGELLRPTADAKGVRLELEVAPGLGHALLDVARLRQVIWNLLSNSIKFTAPGGAVTMKLDRSDGVLQLEVSDTGEGIAPEFMPQLFERFSQADMSDARPHGGLGIGLALCRHLVELQGGTIEAQSEGPGHGARFRVRLPLIEPEVPSSGAARAHATLERRDLLAGVTVLLVEDDEYTLAGMRVTLERTGAGVIAMNSAVAALAAFEALEPSTAPLVLVSDMVLPVMSGYELIERLATARRARGLPPIPACAVSGHAREDDRARAIAAGFDLYLVKPITPERLVEAVVDLTHLLQQA